MSETNTIKITDSRAESQSEQEYLHNAADLEGIERQMTQAVGVAVRRLGLEDVVSQDIRDNVIFEGMMEIQDLKKEGESEDLANISDFALRAIIVPEIFTVSKGYFDGVLEGLDQNQDINVQNLHFLPTLTDKEGRPSLNIDDGEVETVAQSLEALGVGFKEGITYLIAVESGLIPKPDVLSGSTNPKFAQFVRRLGFQSLLDETEQQELQQMMEEEFNGFEPLEPMDNVEVVCKYETFRDNLVELYKAKGYKIVARYQKMLQERELGQDQIA